jgi:hypothetical protein
MTVNATAGGDAEATAKKGIRYRIERTIAPNVDPAWTQQVLIELRLQGVPGSQIAAVLAEVDSHVVDSGQDAATAFGEPVAYARSLGLPPDPDQELTATPTAVVVAAGQIVGTMLLCGGAYALGAGETAPVTWGLLGTAVLATFGAALVLRFGDRVLRAALGSVWRFALSTGVAMVLVLLPTVLLQTTVAELDARLVVAAGAALLLGTAVPQHRQAGPGDPLTSPFDDEPLVGPAHLSRRSSWIASLSLLGMAALFAGGVYVLGRLA